MQKNVYLTLKVDGTEIDAATARGTEAVNQHFRISVFAFSSTAKKAADLVGKPASLAIADRSRTSTLTITGIVRKVSCRFENGDQKLEIEIGPAAELFTQSQDSFVYLDMTSADIASAALTRCGLASGTDFKWSASATPPTRPYTAQYRESHFGFVDRVTREDGVYWFYDHGASGTMVVFADDSTKGTAIDGSFVHQLRFGVMQQKASIGRVSTRVVTTTNKFTTNDRDPLKPTLSLSSAATAGTGDLEIYAWPARAVVAADVTTRAKNSLDGLRARRTVVRGRSEEMAIRVGQILTIDDDDSPLDDARKKLFVFAISWAVPDTGVFNLELAGVPSTVPFRPAWVRPGRSPLGAESAFVRGAASAEISVDANGMVPTQPPWDRATKTDDSVTKTIRVGQSVLVRSMAIPRVGWTTLLAHHDDDIDRAWVVGRLIDGAHVPAYKLPDNMTRTSWQTLTSNSDSSKSEITYEDKTGSELIDVNAAKDMKVTIGDNEARTVGNRHVLEVTGDRSVTVSADEKLTVTKDQSVTVKGDEATTIDGSRSLTVKGGETTTISGGRTEKATKDRTIDVGGDRSLTVSATMSVKSTKELTREILGKHTITAADAWTTQADGGLVMTTKGDGEETIAASRTSNGKSGMEMLVKGDLKDSIAAAHTVTAKGSAAETAKGKMKLTVSAALTATAPTIEISAESEITIACGPATISIKSSAVEIKAPMLTMTGPLIVLDGATVKHNP